MTSPLITEPQPPTIAYAALHDDDASLPRSLRRLIGWFALIYGGSSAIAYMYFIALSRNWLPTRVNFGDFASLQTILDLTWVLALALVAVAGVWLLRLGHTAVILVRMTATMALLAMLMRQTYERSGATTTSTSAPRACCISSPTPLRLPRCC